MKKLYTFQDDVLNLDYDLVVTTFGELRNEVVKSSGKTIQEIRERYDSLAPKELQEKKEENEEVYQNETVAKLKEIYKDKTLYNRMKKGLKNLKDTTFLRETRNCRKIFKEDEELLNIHIENLNKAKSFEEMIEYLKGVEIIKSTKKEISTSSSIKYTIDLFNPMYTTKDSWMLRKYLLFLTKGEPLDSYYREYSETYKKNSGVAMDNFNIAGKNKRFAKDRAEKAKLGLENYVFVVTENEDKFVLLDGFNRLFGSAYEPLEKEIQVKVYKEITEENYGKLVLNLNDWKIKTLGYKSSIQVVLDRGMLFSLEELFGLNSENIVNNYKYLSKYYNTKIQKGLDRESFVAELYKLERLVEYMDSKNLNEGLKALMYSLATTKKESSFSDVIIEDKLIDDAINWLESDKVREHFEKMNTYDKYSLLKNYINKHELISVELPYSID